MSAPRSVPSATPPQPEGGPPIRRSTSSPRGRSADLYLRRRRLHGAELAIRSRRTKRTDLAPEQAHHHGRSPIYWSPLCRDRPLYSSSETGPTSDAGQTEQSTPTTRTSRHRTPLQCRRCRGTDRPNAVCATADPRQLCGSLRHRPVPPQTRHSAEATGTPAGAAESSDDRCGQAEPEAPSTVTRAGHAVGSPKRVGPRIRTHPHGGGVYEPLTLGGMRTLSMR